jgi:hypothetical protein
MATRTISLKDQAYNRLKAARRYPDESFSEVVLRATWPEDTITAKAWLSSRDVRRPLLGADELDRLEAFKRAQGAPEDKWAAN